MFKKQIKHITNTVVIILLTFCVVSAAYSQGRTKSPPPTQVEAVKTGGHPEYTRILINLSQATPYQVQADFLKKQIYLSFENTVLASHFQTKVFKDKNLDNVEVDEAGKSVKISVHLKNSNSRFIHFTRENQVIIDVKGANQSFIQTRIGSTKPVAVKEGKAAKEVKESKAKPDTMSPEEIAEALKKANEEKFLNGWDDYQKALKTFQEKKYQEVLPMFRKYVKDYPKSEYLDQIAYLNAEAEYRILLPEEHKNYEKAVAAYLYALRKYPDSRFQDHTLMKLAHIYNEMGYILEAKSLFEDSLRNNPDSLYTPSRNIGMASLLLYDKQFDNAYAAFQRILKDAPKDEDARRALSTIAAWYYDQQDYEKALKIYEDSETRWPIQFSRDPKTIFNMAEIYFRQKKYPQARNHYFDLINLNPDEEMAHKALNRVGDSYLIEGKYMAGLSVFDESAKRKPGSRESQYGLIRMADIGTRDSNLPLHDIIFDLSPYYQPFKTYAKVFNEAADMDILSEVTLSRAIAYLQGQRYLEAIDEFKKLLPLGPDSKYYKEAQKYIKQALVLLVDRFSKQTGNLPILYTFTDYQSLSLGEIDNIKTLLQIGEAYQEVSMYQEAAKFYETVKKLDINGVYTDRIFLNLGRIHLEQKNYNEAEVVAMAFLNNYPESAQAPKAMQLLAASHRGRKQYDQAIKVFQDLLIRAKHNPAEIHYMMGDIYTEMNRLPDAIQSYLKTLDSYDRSTRVTPEFVPETYYKLGILYYRAKNYPKALETLKAAKELFPKNEFKDWNGYMVADILTQLTEKDQATKELNNVLLSETANDLLKKVAESKLKMLDWEKKFKEFL